MKRILISRTDALGDVVLTLPIVGYLKRLWRDSYIGFIGREFTKPLLECCDSIDEILIKEDLLKRPNQLKDWQADAILFIYPDRPLARLAYEVKIPKRIGTSHRLFHWLYLNRRLNFSRRKSDLHEAQLNFKLLSGLTSKPSPPLEEIPNYYDLQIQQKYKFDHLCRGAKFNLIIHPKSKGSAREWSLKHYETLIAELPPEYFSIFITGTAAEADLIRKTSNLLDLPTVQNVTGRFSLREFIAFIAAVDGLVACSTGPLHIAAALGKVALGLFAPMRPIHPGRWKPLGKQAYYFCADRVCSDCKKKITCRCINSIEPQKVADYLKKMRA